MTTRELHIGIDLELQKLNSSVTQNIQPQEKDWFINKEVLKYIDKVMSGTITPLQKGFQDVTSRIDDLINLIRPATRSITIQDGKGVFSLPSDCYRLYAVDVTMAKDCGTTITNSTKKEYRTVIPLSSISKTYNTFKVEIVSNGSTIVLASNDDIPVGYLENLNFKKQKFMLVKALKILLPKKLDANFTSYDLYWQNDRDGYIEDSFILYTDIPISISNVVFNSSVVSTPSTSSTVDVIDPTKYPLESSVRIIDDEFYTDAKNSHLSKSTSVSPIARRYRNSVEIAIPSGVVLGHAKVRYICHPGLADVLLGSNIDLSDRSLDKVLTNTVAYLKAVIQSNNYQAYKTENILTE